MSACGDDELLADGGGAGDGDLTILYFSQFCVRDEAKVGLFLQFVFEGRVCLNGKDLRVWSAVRPELQNVFSSAFDFVQTFDAGTAKSSSTAAKGGDGPVNAFVLARALLETYVSKPIHDVVMDADEGETLKRVAQFMGTQYQQSVVPLKNFLKARIKLPISLHDAVKNVIMEWRN